MPPPIAKAVAALERAYGKPEPLPKDPWELILRENAAYLVDDATRDEVYRSLAAKVGTSPEAILSARPGALEAAIAKGGMRPPMRAEKLREAASLARDAGGPAELRRLARAGGAEARKVLKKFPGIGEPGADKLLLAAGGAVTLAPDSNALRVLVRLGFAKEEKSYSATYRAAAEGVKSQLEADRDGLAAAHQLLRRHGQETCRRSNPACEACPLAAECDFVPC